MPFWVRGGDVLAADIGIAGERLEDISLNRESVRALLCCA